MKTYLLVSIAIFSLSIGILNARAAKQNAKGVADTLKTSLLKTDAIIQPKDSLKGLHLKLEKDSTAYFECGIYFSSKWSDNYDINDAYILPGLEKVSIYSFTRDGDPVGINSMGDYTKRNKRIKLFVKGAYNGLYHLKLEDIRNIDTALFNIYLVDNLKKDSLDIVRYRSYAFDISNADTNTFGAKRFVLAVERKYLPPYDLISFEGQKLSGGIQLNWTTYNEGNYTGFVLQKQTEAGVFIQLDSLQSYGATNYSYIDKNPSSGNNVYRLKQNDINGLITYSSPVTINYSNVSTANTLSVYPNPSRELITININPNVAKTGYSSNIYNMSGELIGHKIINDNTWTQDISLYKTGIYIIELKGNNGNLLGKTRFVKAN